MIKDRELLVLTRALSAMKLSMPKGQCRKALAFLHYLVKWNAAYNLTARSTVDEMLSRHFLDSLAIAPYLSGCRILDVGTGAGFPGVPLALYYPDRQFVLLDSRGKKIRFLMQLKSALSIENIELVQTRVERYQPDQDFDAIVFRAVTRRLSDMLVKIQHLCCDQTLLLAMKGRHPPQDELQAVNRSVVVHKLSVWGLEAQRHLVVVGCDRLRGAV